MTEDAATAQRRLEVILQAVGDGVITLDTNGCIVHANSAAARLMGAPVSELIGKDLHEWIAPRRRSGTPTTRDESPLWATLRERTVQHVRGGESFRRADGQYLDVDYVSSPLVNDEKTLGAVLVFRATADKERGERALRESEERFRRLSEAAREGIVIHEKGLILDANDAFATMFGYPHAELAGRELLSIVAPESGSGMAERLRSGTEGLLEATGVKKGGQKFPVEVSTRAIPHDGRLARVSTIRDLSDRKLATEAEARATKRIVEIYEQLPEPFFAVDREFKILYLNPAAVASAPIVMPNKLVGQKLWDAFPEWKGSKFDLEYQRAIKEQVPVRVEDYSPTLDRWFEAAAYPSEEGLSIFYRDVTERHKTTPSRGTGAAVSRSLVRKIVRDLVEVGGVAHQFLLEVGRKLASDTSRPDMDIAGIAKNYRDMGLGELTVDKSDEGRFTFVGQDLLERQTGSRTATCFFTLGYLSESVSQVSHGEPTLGTEIECQSRGSTHCRFIVQIKKQEDALARRVKELV